jgi:hypothetical protein
MKLKTLLLIFILYTPFANAGITDRNEYFTSSCEERVGTGLFWEKDRNWHAYELSEKGYTKFVAKKIKVEDYTEENKYAPKSGECILTMGKEYLNEIEKKALEWNERDWKSDKIGVSQDGCYNIREFGRDFMNDETRVCREFWLKKGGIRVLKSVSCEDIGVYGSPFYFSPDGWFHTAIIDNDLREFPSLTGRFPTKDSMTLTVGRCSPL